MNKVGIALSLYDKIPHLKTNISVIRNHWKTNNDAFISVCCNSPALIEEIRGLDVDSVVEGDNIEYVDKPSRRMRIFDCIKKSVSSCNSEFIVHFHSDAYALDPTPILEIIDHMDEKGYHIAFRGKGLDYRNPKTFAGDVDDHFLIFRRSEILSRSLFEMPQDQVKKVLTVGNPETLLSLLIQNKFKKDEIFHYDDMRCNLVHETCIDEEGFYSDGIRHRHMNPFNIDPNRSFYHIGDNDLIYNTLIGAGLGKDHIFFESKNKDAGQEHLDEWLNE